MRLRLASPFTRCGILHRGAPLGTSATLTRVCALRYSSASTVSSEQAGTEQRSLGLSYSHTPSARPLLGVTIGRQLEWAAARAADRDAFVFTKLGVRLSFAELLKKADRVAAALHAMGVRRGDRVGLWGVNSPEWVLSHAGALRAGALLVNLHPGYRPAEIEYTLNKAEVSVLLVQRAWRTQDYISILRGLAPELEALPPRPGPLALRRLPHLRHIALFGGPEQRGMHVFEELVKSASDERVREVQRLQEQIQFDDPAQMMFTSGTTGKPKGVVLTHFNLMNDAYFTNVRLGHVSASAPARVCCPLAFYHTFANTAVVLSAAACLNTVVVPAEFFHAEDTLRAVQAERCTALLGTPTMFIDLLAHPRLAQYDLSSLRGGAAGGAPVPHAMLQRVAQKLHMPHIMIGYGSTEMTCCSHHVDHTDSLEVRTTCVGRQLEHLETKLVDADGRVVPRGQVGELCLRGYAVMSGYWKESESTAQVTSADGWYHSGDLATMDAADNVRIVGRLKDLVVRGGSNVYPAEIEQVLHQHPAVQDAQVVGVPDERLGEEVCACVRLKEVVREFDKQELIEFCKERISHFKAPRYVIVMQEPYPLTATGKVQKFKLREIAVKTLHLEHIASHTDGPRN